jgi:hypothetical protein
MDIKKEEITKIIMELESVLGRLKKATSPDFITTVAQKKTQKNEKNRKYYETKKAEINAKRKEKYAEKKKSKSADNTEDNSIDTTVSVIKTPIPEPTPVVVPEVVPKKVVRKIKIKKVVVSDIDE